MIRTAPRRTAPAPVTNEAAFASRDAAVGELGEEAASCSVGAAGGGSSGTGGGAVTGNEGAARLGEPGTGPRPRPGAVAAMGAVGLGGPRAALALPVFGGGAGGPFPPADVTQAADAAISDTPKEARRGGPLEALEVVPWVGRRVGDLPRLLLPLASSHSPPSEPGP